MIVTGLPPMDEKSIGATRFPPMLEKSTGFGCNSAEMSIADCGGAFGTSPAVRSIAGGGSGVIVTGTAAPLALCGLPLRKLTLRKQPFLAPESVG